MTIHYNNFRRRSAKPRYKTSRVSEMTQEERIKRSNSMRLVHMKRRAAGLPHPTAVALAKKKAEAAKKKKK